MIFMKSNRRLKDIQKEKRKFQDMLDNASTISDCLAYNGKIDILEKEEKEILEKMEL
mgnify:CR=1 FL=1